MESQKEEPESGKSAKQMEFSEACLLNGHQLNLSKLEPELWNMARNLGLTMTRIKVNAIAQRPSITAFINPRGWQIEISVNPNFKGVEDEKTKQYLQGKNAQATPLAEVHDVLYHEVGHWKYCPMDLENHLSMFLEPISRILRERSSDGSLNIENAQYLANMVEDIVTNTANRRKISMAGQIVFWKEQGQFVSQQKYSPLYETFVKLNLHIWGGNEDREFLNNYFGNYKEAEAALKDIVSSLDLKENLRSESFLLKSHNWKHVSEVMAEYCAPLLEADVQYDMDIRWSKGSNKNSKTQSKSSNQDQGHAKKDKSGSQQGDGNECKEKQDDDGNASEKVNEGDKKEKENSNKNDGKETAKGDKVAKDAKGSNESKENGEGDDKKGGDGKDNSVEGEEGDGQNDKKAKRSAGKGEYVDISGNDDEHAEDAEGDEAGGESEYSPAEMFKKLFGTSKPFDNNGNELDKVDEEKVVMEYYKAGKGIPSFFNSYQALSSLYYHLAKSIEVNAKSMEKGLDFPYAPIRHRQFDSGNDNPEDIDFTKIGIDSKGRPALMVPKTHLSLPFRIKHGIEHFPPIAVCVCDSSGSMQAGMGGHGNGNTNFIPWGDESKYHYALLGFFGILNYLKENGLLARVGINTINFSGSSEVGKGISNAVKNLLTPQFKGTAIDINAIRSVSSRDGILFTISDGIVYNWKDIKAEFKNIVKIHQFFHIQIGPKSDMSKDLEKMGFKVYHVNTGKELASLMVDLTSEAYSKIQ